MTRFRFLIFSSMFLPLFAQVSYLPHITSAGGGFSTRLIAANGSGSSAGYTIKAYNNHGELLVLSSGSLDAGATSYLDPNALFSDVPVSHLAIEGNVTFHAIYLSNRPGAGPVHVPQSSETSQTWRIYLGDAQVTWDGAALVNPGEAIAGITLTLVNADGEQSEISLSENAVGPHSKTLLYLNGLMAWGSDSHVVIESDQPILMVALRGTLDSQFLWENQAVSDLGLPPSSNGPPNLTHLGTTTLAAGTHRPEIMATDSGQILLVVVQPDGDTGPGAAIGTVKHQAYLFDQDLRQQGNPYPVSTITEAWGEPADHRAALVDDQLYVVYQSLHWKEDTGPGGGPAEDNAEDQSLVMAVFHPETGIKTSESALVETASDLNEENFPDHCLLWFGEHFLTSTGTRSNRFKIREITKEGQLLATHVLNSNANTVPEVIGNSMVAVNGSMVMFSASGPDTAYLTASRFSDSFQPTQVAIWNDDQRERNFPTGALVIDDYIYLGYISRTRGGDGDLEMNPYGPYLMILDLDFNIIDEIEVPGTGFAHVHPTLAHHNGLLYLAWSSKEDGEGPPSPQVKVERFQITH